MTRKSNSPSDRPSKQPPKQPSARLNKPEANPYLDPESRLAEKFDSASIAKFPVGSPDKMGMRVLDDCAEQNIK